MRYMKEREISRLRSELRTLEARTTPERVGEILARLRELAADGDVASPELDREIDRWSLRFALVP